MHLKNLPAITPCPVAICFKTIHRSEVQKLFGKRMWGRHQGERQGGWTGSSTTTVGVQTLDNPQTEWYIKLTQLGQKASITRCFRFTMIFLMIFFFLKYQCPKFLTACRINLARFIACTLNVWMLGGWREPALLLYSLPRVLKAKAPVYCLWNRRMLAEIIPTSMYSGGVWNSLVRRPDHFPCWEHISQKPKITLHRVHRKPLFLSAWTNPLSWMMHSFHKHS